MTARHRLNSAYFNGAILTAGLVAALTESATVFVVLLVLLSATATVSGDIRLTPRRRRR